jgi:hypothetical protein
MMDMLFEEMGVGIARGKDGELYLCQQFRGYEAQLMSN